MIVREEKVYHRLLRLASSLRGTTDGKEERRVLAATTRREDDDDDTRDDVSDATHDVRSKRVAGGGGDGESLIGSSGLTQFQFACRHGHAQVVRSLIAGADVRVRDSLGNTPLQDACKRGHLEIVKLLLRHGASVDSRSDSGNTALHDACWKGHFGMMRYLIRNGHASIDIRNNNGHTPLQLARLADNHAIVKYLEMYEQDASSVARLNHLEKIEQNVPTIVRLPHEQINSTMEKESTEVAMPPLDESAFTATIAGYFSHERSHVFPSRATTPTRRSSNVKSQPDRDNIHSTTPTRRSERDAPEKRPLASPNSIRRSPLPIAPKPRAPMAIRRSSRSTRYISTLATIPESSPSPKGTKRRAAPEDPPAAVSLSLVEKVVSRPAKLPPVTLERSVANVADRPAVFSPQLTGNKSKGGNSIIVAPLSSQRTGQKSTKCNPLLPESASKATGRNTISSKNSKKVMWAANLPVTNRIGIPPNPKTIATLKSSMVTRIEKLEEVVGIQRRGRDAMLRRLSDLEIAVFGSARQDSVAKRLSHLEKLFL